jgi:hypothetical protein
MLNVLGDERTVVADLLDLICEDGKRFAMVMKSFVDESGTHKGSPFIAVAGWAGARWQWCKFLSHWGDKPFHAKDPSSEPLKYGLIEAIQFAGVEGFVAWMNPEDYIPNSTALFRSGIGNAYSLCAFACLLGMSKLAERPKTAKMAIVIEDGQTNAKFVRDTMDSLKEKRQDLAIASVSLASKAEFMQLVSADFLAHSRTSDERWFNSLMETGQVQHDRIGPEKVQRMSEQLQGRYNYLKREKELRRAERRASRKGIILRHDKNG